MKNTEIESNNEEEELDENILDTDIIQAQEEINFIENRLKKYIISKIKI